jgi:predicted amidohydrolase YtcJ
MTGGTGRPNGGLLLRDVVVDGRLVDVRTTDGVIVAIDRPLPPRPGEQVIDGVRGALLPGLHDHHIHLVALAAVERAPWVGPPVVNDAREFAAALRRAHAALGHGEWLGAVGYHESVAGPLDRWRLDALVVDRPVRVQHRTGGWWVLNSRGLVHVGLAGDGAAGDAVVSTTDPAHAGVERDDGGRPTGRLQGLDRWLRDRLPPPAPPDLAAVGRRLSRYGVTGVTDATPVGDLGDLGPIAEAAARGALPQRVVVTGGPRLAAADMPAPLARGPVKLLVTDYALPRLDDLVRWMRAAHSAGRPVAVHCVTRAALGLALAAWDDAGALAGDRVEHGSVVPPDLRSRVVANRLAVVTQPGFVEERGDRFLAEVDEDDLPHLYPCRSLIEAGIPVGGGTDAPFGHPDPWRAIASAIERRTAHGAPLGVREAVSPERALALYLTPLEEPGGEPRRVAVGAPADLCLLDRPLSEVLEDPSSSHVALAIHGGAPAAP